MEYDPPWPSIQSTVEIIHNQQIDVIHAHLPKAHVLAGLAGCLTRTPVVATIHGMSITTHELGVSRTTGTHLILVCREAYFQAQALGLSEAEITLISNGVDVERFKPDPVGSEFRKMLGIPADAPLVGFVGRLASEKGPDTFVLAAKHVHRQQPDVHFVLVGEGPMEADLVQMIEDLELRGRVHLAGLWPDTSQVYPALDVLAQTSRVEGMPLALLEGMACALPVVAIAVGGVSELVVVGTTGVLVGPGDWEGIGNAVLALLANPKQLAHMGQAGRQRVETLFSLENSVKLTGDLFRRLAKSRVSQRSRTLIQPSPVVKSR
jgi:glycosyltransferase involved in cell wall biosynthesis